MFCAGLGDIAVPGLLACLALRYDASRSTNFRGRQLAAAQALQASLDSSLVRPDLLLWLSSNYILSYVLLEAYRSRRHIQYISCSLSQVIGV